MNTRQRLIAYLESERLDQQSLLQRVNAVDGDLLLTAAELRSFIETGRSSTWLRLGLDDFLDGIKSTDNRLAPRSTPEPYTGPVYNNEERDRILKTLLAYSDEHRIGSTILARRINGGVNDPRWLRSFRRFFEATENPQTKKPYRTHDRTIALCAEFTNGLTVADPIGDLGMALAKHHGYPTPKLLGGYTLRAIPTYALWENPVESALTVDQDNGFCRVIMTGDDSLTYEGVIVQADNMVLIHTAEIGLRRPRTYMLEQHNDQSLSGHGLHNSTPFSVEVSPA